MSNQINGISPDRGKSSSSRIADRVHGVGRRFGGAGVVRIGQSTVTLIGVALLAAACETPTESTTRTDSSARTGAASEPMPEPGVVEREPVPGTDEDFVVNVGDRVFFEFDSFGLNSIAQETLKDQATWLQVNPSVTVVVEGHTDEKGTREYNVTLGDRRANAARDYLVGLGIIPDRIKTISYGMDRPSAVGSNEGSWAQNRWAVTVVNTR